MPTPRWLSAHCCSQCGGPGGFVMCWFISVSSVQLSENLLPGSTEEPLALNTVSLIARSSEGGSGGDSSQPTLLHSLMWGTKGMALPVGMLFKILEVISPQSVSAVMHSASGF
ncbi:UNVERIFIED_CONTAM: hypothetical protein FKN15_041467 [Acipenser sinensis]